MASFLLGFFLPSLLLAGTQTSKFAIAFLSWNITINSPTFLHQLESCFFVKSQLYHYTMGILQLTWLVSFPNDFSLSLSRVTAALINWSLISFFDLIAFLLLHYIAPEIGKSILSRFLVSHLITPPLRKCFIPWSNTSTLDWTKKFSWSLRYGWYQMFAFSNYPAFMLSFVRIPLPEETLAIMAHFHLFLCSTCYTSCVPCRLGYCWSRLGYIRYWLDESYWLYHVSVLASIFNSSYCHLILSCHWFCRLKSWRNPTVMYFLALQLLASLVALADIYSTRFGFLRWRDTRWSHFSEVFEQLGL